MARHAPPVLLLVGLLAGCAGGGQQVTVRLIDGKPQPGRYVSPGAYDHYLQSQVALQRGELDAAGTHLRAALAHDPQSPYLHTRLAQVLARQSKPELAMRALQRALEHGPGFADALVLRGRLYEKRGQPGPAAASYRACMRYNPGHAPAYLALAALLERQERAGRARAVVQRLIERDPGSSAAHRRLAVLCLRQLDYRCAARHLARALEARTDLNLLLQLAHVHRSVGHMRRAIRLLREAFDRSGGNAAVAALLIEVLSQTGDRQGVDDLLTIMADGAGDHPEAVKNVAALALSVDRHRRALALVERQVPSGSAAPLLQIVRAEALLELGRTDEARKLLGANLSGAHGVMAATRMARLHQRRGDDGAASEVLRRALRQHGHSNDLVLALARSLQHEGKHDDAVHVVRQALLGHPDSRRLRFGLAGVLERAGRWRAAIKTVRAIIAKHPKYAPGHNFIGYTLLEQGKRLDEAERLIRRALYLQPGEGYIIDSLGWLYHRRGDHARARRLLWMAHRLSPREPEILFHLAEAEAASNRLTRAIQLLERALPISEDARLTRRIKRRLNQLMKRRVGSAGP